MRAGLRSSNKRTWPRPQSCTFCRSRKLRCSRKAPCPNCTSRGIPCEFAGLQNSVQDQAGSSNNLDSNLGIHDRLQQLEELVAAQNAGTDDARQRAPHSASHAEDSSFRRSGQSDISPRLQGLTNDAVYLEQASRSSAFLVSYSRALQTTSDLLLKMTFTGINHSRSDLI